MASSAEPDARGMRSYKLDPEAAAVQISIQKSTSPSTIGTPDTSKFSYLMRMLKNAGELVTVSERSPADDGTVTICGVFSASANRDGIYEILRSTEIDAKHTNFIAASVAACTK